MSDSIDLHLSEEQRLVRNTAREFSKQSVKPLARKIDHEHYYPKELIPKLAELGFMGVTVDEAYGGSGLDQVSYCLMVEELARVCASTCVIVSAHNSLCLWPLQKYGTEEQKKEFLPPLASGKELGCFALSEPSTGSDAARLLCTCKKKGDKWIINGVKNWITNAPEADVCILLAMEKPEEKHRGINTFIVRLKDDNGISIGKKEDKLGICGSPTASITFEDTELDASRLLGEPGQGFKVAMTTLDGGRCGIAAQATGIAQAALDDSVEYSKQRKAFGKLISEHQSVQNHLADMSMKISCSRLMTFHAASLKQKGLPYSREAAEAKLFASEMAVEAGLKGIQVHGGYGYVREFNAERYLRDAKITEIYEGTSEIQRLVIAAQLLKD